MKTSKTPIGRWRPERATLSTRIEDVASPVLSSQLNCQSDPLKQVQLRGLCTSLLASWHLLSLDAPSVAVVWAYAIARAAHVHLQPWIALLLFSGTWTVYVLDRILDARRAINANSPTLLRDRHHFHWRYRQVFVPLATCTGLAATAIIFKLMPAAARRHDSLIAAAALAYFSGVHSSAALPRALRHLCSKEMLVGILFAAGCAAPTLTRLHSASAWPTILIFGFFAAIAWLNCVSISRWESQSSSDISSAAFTISLIALAVALLLPATQACTSALLVCAALSPLLIAGLHRRRDRLQPVTLRALADLVLLAPAILLITGVGPQ